jgi:hypothetical protein
MSHARHASPSGAGLQDVLEPPTDPVATIRIPNPRTPEPPQAVVPPPRRAGQSMHPAPGATMSVWPPTKRTGRDRSRIRPGWVGVGALAGVVVIAIAASVGTSRAPTSPSTSTQAAPATSGPALPTSAFVLTTSAAAPSSKLPIPPPQPKKQAPVPAPRPRPKPPPPPEAPSANCDPNYGGCVPVASDVDCEGGGGDGPAFLSRPVEVTGSDVYGLDSDDDGVACE